MKTLRGDLWSLHAEGHWCCIPTNGTVKGSRELVMGRGVAKDAAIRFPWIPLALGDVVEKSGNKVVLLPSARLISFPTKNYWRNPSCLKLIENSALQLLDCWPIITNAFTPAPLPVCLPKVGCGLGGLSWDSEVYPLLNQILDDNFIAVI